MSILVKAQSEQYIIRSGLGHDMKYISIMFLIVMPITIFYGTETDSGLDASGAATKGCDSECEKEFDIEKGGESFFYLTREVKES